MSTDDFWTTRPVLTHIRDFARGRRVGPSSTLGVALVRASCQIPPHVVIEPLIGGHAALNLSVALVGKPGAGVLVFLTASLARRPWEPRMALAR